MLFCVGGVEIEFPFYFLRDLVQSASKGVSLLLSCSCPFRVVSRKSGIKDANLFLQGEPSVLKVRAIYPTVRIFGSPTPFK